MLARNGGKPGRKLLEGYLPTLGRIALAPVMPPGKSALLVSVYQPCRPVACPLCLNGKRAASVDFALPPFCEEMTMVFIKYCFQLLLISAN